MFDCLTEADQELIEELAQTALSHLEAHPTPGLVRAFAWLEARRLSKNWVLYELGLLLLRGSLLRAPGYTGVARALLAEARRRKSPWLRELAKPMDPPRLVGLAKPSKQKRDGWKVEAAARAQAFLSGYDTGAEFHLIPVIAFRGAEGRRPVVTVWGFKAGRFRWPSAANTKARRKALQTRTSAAQKKPKPRIG